MVEKMMRNKSDIQKRNDIFFIKQPFRTFMVFIITFLVFMTFATRQATAAAAENQSGKGIPTDGIRTMAVSASEGELHAFYPSSAVYSGQTEKYIDSLDSISFAWSRIDAENPGVMNTEKGKNGNYGFYYPKDYLQPVKYAKSKGKTIQLNVYMDGSDCAELLPDSEKQSAIINAVIDCIQRDITSGEGIYYDGVVIDFEGLCDTNRNKEPILYGGKQISTYFTQFLTELKARLEPLGKKLYVAVNPLIYFDGYNYKDILDLADRVILMAHDYEPTQKLMKSEVLQYSGYNALEPIDSLSPIWEVRQALNEMSNAASGPSQLSKVWLQIAFDSAQWRYAADSEKEWEALPATTLSKERRMTPLYKSIKARVDNKDGYGENITYSYNNELQSPYIHYYNTSDKSWNFILYEDSNSISAKIDLAKTYGLGGISLWSLANLPDYSDSVGKKYHLDGWETILSKMASYDKLPSGSKEYISFTDQQVEQAVREKLGKASGKITKADIQSIYRLKLSEGTKSLKDLTKLTNLEYLDAGQLNLKDITSIGSLTKLRVLYLQRNAISDIQVLKKLTKLEILSLNGNKLTTISGLSALTNLRELYLRENQLTSVTALSKLSKLEILELGKNCITKVENLKNLNKLKRLALDFNKISGLGGLEKMKKLQHLDLSNNQISDISLLSELTGLKTLYLQRNSLRNTSSLSGLSKLNLLSLNGNKISEVKSLAKLTALEKLYLKDNEITSIAPLKGLTGLKELYLQGNRISDYNPVKSVYSKSEFLCDFTMN